MRHLPHAVYLRCGKHVLICAGYGKKDREHDDQCPSCPQTGKNRTRRSPM